MIKIYIYTYTYTHIYIYIYKYKKQLFYSIYKIMELICHHKNWNDTIILDNTRLTLIRSCENKDTGKYILSENFLKIIWDKWNPEYFYSNDLINYYYEEITYIYFNNSEFFILDDVNHKIYFSDLRLFGKFTYDKNDHNKITVYENEPTTYILINHKYYNYYEIMKEYKIIYIYNNQYILSLNEKKEYSINNFIKIPRYTYKIYKNKLMLNENGIKSIYISYIDNPINYKPYTSKIQEIPEKNLKDENTLYIINYDNSDALIEMMEYYNNFGIMSILFDNNKNIDKNILYDEYNILYYDENEFEKTINYMKIYRHKFISKNTFLNIDFKKNIKNINIKNINIKNINKKSLNNLFLIDLLKKNNINYTILDNKFTYDIRNILNDSIMNVNININKSFSYTNPFSSDKLMHFIWVGPNEIPTIYYHYMESWINKHPEWTFCFWHDNNLPKLVNQKYYDEACAYAMKADILRYELLYFLGGVYVDCDFICCKNIDELIAPYDAFSGYESDKYIAIGLMGFKRGNPLLLDIIKEIPIRIIQNSYTQEYTIPEMTGPILFTEIWNKHIQNQNNKNKYKYHAFHPKYFYSYTFDDKHNNRKYKIKDDTYAIHMWGYSWNDGIQSNVDTIPVYPSLNDLMSRKKPKKKIVHIMGLFFTGGIERYLYYIDKYGNHEEYQYYLLYISNNNYVYKIKNMIIISYDWNHTFLNQQLLKINPALIIDHYSIYTENNANIYENINRNIVLTFVHSALCYNNDITHLNIQRCIHLYDEQKKNKSWKRIMYNHYVTLGTELNESVILANSSNVKKIGIIGRIAEEKIPLSFLEKLALISNSEKDMEFHIYGEKDKIFSQIYVEQFEEIIANSNIYVHPFIDPLNISNIYKTLDILLIPSVYETGSFTCIEAMAHGIPVIARNVYGLKYIIKDEITGYLCNSDDEIINKLKNPTLFNDINNNNKHLILEEAKKYNIIDKVKDFENILKSSFPKRNLIIITSVLNTVSNPLSYHHTRSVYDVEERYGHTLKTIESINKYIPYCDILFCECSDLDKNPDIEDDIKKRVKYYYNFFNDENVRNAVNCKLKGFGEASLLLKAIEMIPNMNYSNLFKISGRYYLNSSFNYEIFNNDYNNFVLWDDSSVSFCTIFYKIHMNCIYLYRNALHNSLDDLEKGLGIELALYKYLKKNIKILDKMNVSGFLATEGYLFSV